MVRAKGHKVNEVLSPVEKEGLNDQVRELKDSLKERRQYGIGTAAEQIDESKIKREISRIENSIAVREVKVTGAERDKLAKEADELEQKLIAGLPTRYEMDSPAKNPGAIRKHMNWMVRNQENVERWRYIQRVINPYDPRSIENLRKEK
jgi:hypothetical protein